MSPTIIDPNVSYFHHYFDSDHGKRKILEEKFTKIKLGRYDEAIDDDNEWDLSDLCE
jgi:hypothetical protein